MQQPLQPEGQDGIQRLNAQDMAYLSTTLVPTGSPLDCDLNSVSATRTLHFHFYGTVGGEVPTYKEDVYLLSTPDPVMLCLELKRWNFKMFLPEQMRAEEMVRVEYLALDRMDVSDGKSRKDRDADNDNGDDEYDEDEGFYNSSPPNPKPKPKTGLPPGEKAHLLILPYAATATKAPDPAGQALALNYSVLAVLLPGDNNIRWFYTPFLLGPLLSHLQKVQLPPQEPLINARANFAPGTKTHGRLHTFVREMFGAAVTFPESLDWRAAVKIGDYCPPGYDSKEGLSRLEGCEFLHNAKWADDGEKLVDDNGGAVVSDDRYLERVGKAERLLSGMVCFPSNDESIA